MADLQLQLPGVFQNKQLRITSEWVSVFDIIRIAGGQRNPSDTWNGLLKQHDITFSMTKFSGRGQKHTPCIRISYLKDFIIKLIPGCRIPMEQKKKLMTSLGIIKNELQRTYVEEEIHCKLIKALKDYEPIKQYPVLGYRIDLYLKKCNIAIECDENNHRRYDKDKETTRKQRIENSLKCTWIRYNPYDTNFCVFDLISKIIAEIYKMERDKYTELEEKFNKLQEESEAKFKRLVKLVEDNNPEILEEFYEKEPAIIQHKKDFTKTKFISILWMANLLNSLKAYRKQQKYMIVVQKSSEYHVRTIKHSQVFFGDQLHKSVTNLI